MNTKERWIFRKDWGTEEEKAKALEFLSDSRFQRLAPHKRQSLINMLKTPGGQELDLLKRVWGKTPSQVVHIMAQEFADRFGRGQYSEYVQAMIKELSPSHSWSELDLKISLFSRAEHTGIDFNDSLKFWDRMRYLIRPLPRGNRKKIDTSPKLQSPQAPLDYHVCDLCWRTVPVNTKTARRGQTLCFEHDLNPNDSVYRKHKRLKEEVLEIAYDLEEKLQAEYPLSTSSAVDVSQLALAEAWLTALQIDRRRKTDK